MLTLITGLPGNAKTLHTIELVKNLAAKENRPVYYSGIKGLTLDWQEIDPLKWMEVPAKAIVVIDECQQIFRNRSLGTVPGKHVTDLETHRHLGIDLFLITQHPSLVDPAIRKLTGCHKHMVRIWGFEASTVHEWGEVRDNCDKPPGRRDSNKSKWKFNKSLYGVYKSADEHTVRRNVPTRVKLLFVLPFVLLVLGGVFYYVMHKRIAPPIAPVSSAGVAVVPRAEVGVQAEKRFDPVSDSLQFVQKRTPRVVGLVSTAAVYDELTKPTRVPVPAMCISHAGGKKCECKSQQGTPLDVPVVMCLQFVEHGFFQEFDPEGLKSADKGVIAAAPGARPVGQAVLAPVVSSPVSGFSVVPRDAFYRPGSGGGG